MKKYLIACLLCAAVAVPSVSAVRFIDTVNHPHEFFIDVLAEHGIVQGYGFGLFRPDQPINRAEFLKILMLGVYGDEAYEVYNVRCFADFEGEEQWYWRTACAAKERGVISGYPDGTFRGSQTVNLAEAMKMATEAWGIVITKGEYAPAYWYIPYFEIAEKRGLFQYFPRNGSHLLTRSDMAYLIVSMDEPIQKVEPQAQSSSSSLPAGECGNGILDAGEQCDDGNKEDGDGCSSICVIVEEPVYHGALRIHQQSVGVQTLAPGAQDVTLMAFDAIAGRQDIAITHLSFRAFTGSLSTASNYRIYADTDNDGIADHLMGTTSPNVGAVTFSSLSIVVPQGKAVRVELVANLQSSVQSGQLGVEFSLNDPRFVQGVGLVDDRDLSGIEIDNATCTESSICWIAVHTIDAEPFQIRSRGNLYVTADSTPARTSILTGGSTSPDLLRLRFRAAGEPVKISKIRIAADEGVFTQLLLFKEGTNTPAGTLYVSDCSPVAADHFCGSAAFTVPQDIEVKYVVRGVLKSKDDGLDSGETVSLSLIADPAMPAIEAQGANSTETLAANDGDSFADGEIVIGRTVPGTNQDIVGPVHDIAYAKISKIENANTDSDQTPVPTGTYTFGKFKFSAVANEAGEQVLIEKLVFTVNATNVQFLSDSFKLLNTDDSSILHDCDETATTGQITVTCDNLDGATVNTEIESGGSITLGLRGFIVNPAAQQGNSVLQASLQSLSNRNQGGTVEWEDGTASFTWVDLNTTTVQSTVYKQ